jgi:hypothetical protein
MTEDFPTLDDVLDYRRRRLVERLTELAMRDADEARRGAVRLLLKYVGDEEVVAAFRRAARIPDE